MNVFLNTVRHALNKVINVCLRIWFPKRLEIHKRCKSIIKPTSRPNLLPIMSHNVWKKVDERSRDLSVHTRTVTWESRRNLEVTAAVWDLVLSCSKICFFSDWRYGRANGFKTLFIKSWKCMFLSRNVLGRIEYPLNLVFSVLINL